MAEGDGPRRGKEALSLSGGHLCHVCGHQYPNPNPSAKLRRSHRRNCRKPTPAGEDQPEEAAGKRNAGEERRVQGGGGGPGDGEEPGNGAASGVNGGSASPGSAEGGGEDKENADEGNGTNLARPCTNGIQHKVPKAFTESAPTAVAHPPEREDSFDEYQDASSFLHQSDPEDGAAVADESDIPTEIKNLDKGSVGTSVAADVISVEMNVLCKDQFSSEPSIPDFPADSKVGNEDGLILWNKDECSTDIGSNATAVVVDRKSDKTSSCGKFIGDLNASSIQKCSPLMSDPESQSACCWKEDSFLKDGMNVLESMSEVPPRPEIVGSDNSGSKTTSNAETNAVPTGDELKPIHTENTSADCSEERTSQNLFVQGTSDVQLPVDNNILVNSACSVPGYQNGLAVTNVDGMVKSIVEDSNTKGISVKCSELDSSCEERPQQVVEQIVAIAEGSTSLEKRNAFGTEEVCNRESDTEAPTKYQVSSSQEHVTLLMDQVSSIKNPFNLDDTRSEDLFELSSGSYHFEEPNVVESKQQIDSTTLTVSNQTSVSDVQHCPISDDRVLDVSNENGYAVGAEDLLVSSSADPLKNISLYDASVNHNKQEGESRSNGIMCAPSEVFPTEFGTLPGSQDINALSAYAEEKIGTEDTDAKDMTAVEIIDNFEGEKQIEDASAKELNAVLHTDNVEEEKLAEDNYAKEAGDETNQGEATGSTEVGAVQSTENVHEEDQTEDSSAKKMDTEFNADNRQTDGTSKEEMYQVQHIDKAEEKKQAEETSAKATSAAQRMDNVAEQKQSKGTVGMEESKQNEEIASLESKEKNPRTKEKVQLFRRRASSKDGASSAKPGSAGPETMRLLYDKKANKRSKQPWVPYICCQPMR